MTPIELTLLFGALFSLYVLVAWLDHKFNWQFANWLNGKCDNPFGTKAHQSLSQNQSQQIQEKNQKIAELTERVQVLERIVTEPAYELNKKINQLD